MHYTRGVSTAIRHACAYNVLCQCFELRGKSALLARHCSYLSNPSGRHVVYYCLGDHGMPKLGNWAITWLKSGRTDKAIGGRDATQNMRFISLSGSVPSGCSMKHEKRTYEKTLVIIGELKTAQRYAMTWNDRRLNFVREMSCCAQPQTYKLRDYRKKCANSRAYLNPLEFSLYYHCAPAAISCSLSSTSTNLPSFSAG